MITSTSQSQARELVTAKTSASASPTICCYLDADVTRWTSEFVLCGDRLLAAQALQLLISLDRELTEARADWNQDRFRRVMRVRAKAVLRVRRRWNGLNPVPAVPLGQLRRRYHANLAGYLYEARMPTDTDLGK